MYIPKEKRRRFDPSGEPGIFLGFNGTKHALVYNFIKQRVAEYRHLRFHENRYPGLISSKERVGRLQDEYFNNPFEDDTFFKTYNHEDHKEESDNDENNHSDQMDDSDDETFEPVDMHKPEFIKYPDGLPDELIDGNDSDADYDEELDIELSDSEGDINSESDSQEEIDIRQKSRNSIDEEMDEEHPYKCQRRYTPNDNYEEGLSEYKYHEWTNKPYDMTPDDKNPNSILKQS